MPCIGEYCAYPGVIFYRVLAEGYRYLLGWVHGAFERAFHADPARPVEVVNVRVVATAPGLEVRLTASGSGSGGSSGRASLDQLTPGTSLVGPLMLDGQAATARIEAGWQGRVLESGAISLEHA